MKMARRLEPPSPERNAPQESVMSTNHPTPLPAFTEEQVARFWSNVAKAGPSDCWPWMLGRRRGKYGKVVVGDRSFQSHRVAYAIAKGDPGGLLVRHSCDNPPCCNPAHLAVGTYAENSLEMVAKGRSLSGDRNPSRTKPECLRRGANHPFVIDPSRTARGEAHGNARFTNADIIQIRADYDSGLKSSPQIARERGCGKNTIIRIVQRIFWKHVPEATATSVVTGSPESPPLPSVQTAAPCTPCGSPQFQFAEVPEFPIDL